MGVATVYDVLDGTLYHVGRDGHRAVAVLSNLPCHFVAYSIHQPRLTLCGIPQQWEAGLVEALAGLRSVLHIKFVNLLRCKVAQMQRLALDVERRAAGNDILAGSLYAVVAYVTYTTEYDGVGEMAWTVFITRTYLA